ncbi:cupin domain-containing protein [Paenibacillus pasadenensis]|uniref:cupin domain-containing protein n=1 Tax=Paenibacillus pasadenensis TaxID=217090 RepID=UPI00203ED267|nr:cupin domain-containing protein [Paenibacillus pasadenensis]MCM3747745.1 cupin domain-containing protein [Paenibacillus pasadenensis]
MQTEPKAFYFHDDGLIPNHPFLPVLVYRSAADNPLDMEQSFASNGWGNTWTDGVYNYHHYHSNTHEVLGVVSGSAILKLGGPEGEAVTARAGDVLVLPAGTGHMRLSASGDFRIAGGYPGGMNYNTRRATPEERKLSLKEINRVPLPENDPVYGKSGPLTKLWRKADISGNR